MNVQFSEVIYHAILEGEPMDTRLPALTERGIHPVLNRITMQVVPAKETIRYALPVHLMVNLAEFFLGGITIIPPKILISNFMKKTILSIIFLLCIHSLGMAQLKSKVNETFELTSIVFRLAGAPEYINKSIPDYADAIDNYFAKYKEHKVIHLAKELRKQNGVSYDAVMAAAAFLEIKNGTVSIRDGEVFSKIRDADLRWSEETFKTFVSYVNDFYRKTNFKNFYTQNAGLYKLAEARLDIILKDIDMNWFQSVFSKKTEEADIVVVASLSNGPHNYAFGASDKGIRSGIVIGSGSDAEGLPAYGKNLTFTVIHELLHDYINPRMLNCWPKIDTAAQKIYSCIKADMQKLAYNNARTMMSEWLINLLSIRYFEEHPLPGLSMNNLLKMLQMKGFIWMERSVVFMKHFYERRNQFGTLDEYMPQITGFINYTAEHFDRIVSEYNNRVPYIVDVFPVSGTSLSAGIDTIVVRFSEPMLASHGMDEIKDEKVIPAPILKMPYWRDEHTFVIILDKNDLEKNKTYGFKLRRNPFQSVKLYPMAEDYIYTFNTNE